MRLLQALLAVYAIMAVIFMTLTFWALSGTRKMEDAESRVLLQKFDTTKDSLGLKDSGMAVLVGLLWPLIIFNYRKQP